MAETLTTIKTTGYLVDGKFSSEGRPVEIRWPYDQRVVGAVAFAGPKQVEAAILAAVRSFEVTRKLPAFERQRVLREVAQQISLRHEELASEEATRIGGGASSCHRRFAEKSREGFLPAPAISE